MPAPKSNTTNALNLPLQSALLDEQGNVTRAWSGLFKRIGDSDAITCDTHANRLLHFPAATRNVGQLYYELDRGALYLNLLNTSDGSPQVWVWFAGTMTGTFAPDQRPTDLTAADAGFLFHASDNLHTYQWSGAVWSRTNQDVVSRTTSIAAPSGGTTIDSQARTAIAAIIAALNS